MACQTLSKKSGPTSPLGLLFRRAAAIVALAAPLGLAWNALHPMGLPLLLRDIEGPAIPRWVWERVPNIGVQAAHERLVEGSALFVDTRDADHYAAHHISGSMNLPYRDFTRAYPNVRDQLRSERPLLIYCYGSHCGLAMRLAKRLLRDGFENLIVMRGGIEEWEAQGLETAGTDVQAEATQP